MSASATFADFKARYPELVSVGDANQIPVETCLAEALDMLNLAVCPKISHNVQLAYAAHCIAKSGNNPLGIDTSSGIVTSESVGSVSLSYQVSESKGEISDWYKSTPYGQDFLRLQKMCFGAAIVVAP